MWALDKMLEERDALSSGLKAMILRIGFALAGGFIASSVNAQILPMERRFAQDAYAGNRDGITLGKLALQKSTSPTILGFARRMVREHSQVQVRLGVLLKTKGIPAPAMSADVQSLYKRLEKLNGRAFDRSYRQAVIVHHQNEISAYSTIANRGNDPDLRRYATNTLPILRMHLDMIRAARV